MDRFVRSLAAGVLLMAGAAHAQSGISVNPMPFGEPAGGLPIAPAATQPRPGVPAPLPTYELRTGEPIHQGLKVWADREGWMLIWHPTVSWKTVRTAVIDAPDIARAVAEVVDILRDEGRPVALRISGGNKVLEVISTEVRND